MLNNMSMSIRQMIQERSEKLRDAANLSAHEIADILVELTSLLASLNAEIEESDYWYRVLLDKKLTELGSAAKAKISAQSSDEYKKVMERKAQKEALIELIRACKYAIRAHSEEYQVT